MLYGDEGSFENGCCRLPRSKGKVDGGADIYCRIRSSNSTLQAIPSMYLHANKSENDIAAINRLT
jgi:hypothetical protein